MNRTQFSHAKTPWFHTDHDQGGHIVARSLDGYGHADNVFPQDSAVTFFDLQHTYFFLDQRECLEPRRRNDSQIFAGRPGKQLDSERLAGKQRVYTNALIDMRREYVLECGLWTIYSRARAKIQMTAWYWTEQAGLVDRTRRPTRFYYVIVDNTKPSLYGIREDDRQNTRTYSDLYVLSHQSA